MYFLFTIKNKHYQIKKENCLEGGKSTYGVINVGDWQRSLRQNNLHSEDEDISSLSLFRKVHMDSFKIDYITILLLYYYITTTLVYYYITTILPLLHYYIIIIKLKIFLYVELSCKIAMLL